MDELLQLHNIISMHVDFISSFGFSPLNDVAGVYADIQAFIRSVLDGYNVCIFAYGQTGSGKTYTMVCNFDHVMFLNYNVFSFSSLSQTLILLCFYICCRCFSEWSK